MTHIAHNITVIIAFTNLSVTDHWQFSFDRVDSGQDLSVLLLHKASLLWLWWDQTVCSRVFLGRASVLNWITVLVVQAERSSSSISVHDTPLSFACKSWRIHMHWASSPLALVVATSISHLIKINQNLEIWGPRKPYTITSLASDRLSHRLSKMVIVKWKYWKQSYRPIMHHSALQPNLFLRRQNFF